jgi:hypothetical protein
LGPDEDGLHINEILAGGLLADWNAANNELSVNPGDTIVEVNGKVGIEGMVSEFELADELVTVIQRQPANQVLVKIKKPSDRICGIKLMTVADDLCINQILPEGLLAEWNHDHNDKRVKPGDKVVRLNGKVGKESMISELRSAAELLITIHRQVTADCGEDRLNDGPRQAHTCTPSSVADNTKRAQQAGQLASMFRQQLAIQEQKAQLPNGSCVSCSTCGHSLAGEANFCMNCGAPRDAPRDCERARRRIKKNPTAKSSRTKPAKEDANAIGASMSLPNERTAKNDASGTTLESDVFGQSLSSPGTLKASKSAITICTKQQRIARATTVWERQVSEEDYGIMVLSPGTPKKLVWE